MFSDRTCVQFSPLHTLTKFIPRKKDLVSFLNMTEIFPGLPWKPQIVVIYRSSVDRIYCNEI